MRKKQIAGIFITGIILLSGCARSSTEPGTVQSADETRTAENDPTNESMETGENSEKTTSFEIDTSDMFSDSDRNVEYNEAESTIIQLSDEGSFCDTDTVVIDQNTVTITDEGTYLLSGSLSDGMLIVNAETTDEVHLVFNQAAISNQDSAAVYIASADKVFLTLADGTENAVSNGGVYADIDEDTIDGAIFSKADLLFNGTGKLIVTAAAGHGIVSKADLIFADGSYEISAAEHGIEGKDSVRIAEGTYEILSGKDGIHSENDEDETLGFIYLKDGIFKIQSQGDGISAGNWLLAENGTYEITTGQGGVSAEEKNSLEQHKQEEQEKSAKGIKAGAQMLLKEGTYCLDTEDEACVLLTQKRNEKDYEFEIEVSLMIDSDRLFEDSRPTYTNIRKYVFDKYGIKLQLKDIADVKRDYGMKMKVNKHLIKGDEPVRRKCTPNKRKYIIEALKYYHAI